jgi:hypothetical protein
VTSDGGGGGDPPPRSALHDDPLHYPASEAGWDDPAPAVKPVAGELPAVTVEVAAAPTVEPAAAPTVEVAAAPTVEPAPPAAASAPSPGTASPPLPSTTDGKPPSSADDEPVLPATYDANDLRAAVGASPLPAPLATTRQSRAPAIDRDDGGDRPPRNRKAIVASAISITAGLAIAALVFVGRANSDRYLLACEPERAVPEQGRGFPPWGTRALEGEPWKPLKITPETRCQPHETDDPRALERLYLAMILDQATALLTAHEVTRLDDAEALLKQALLLTRPPEHEPEKLALERNERHQDIERMLGDVTYWRASARLHDAQAALTDAAKQFDRAAAQHPRHVSDAAAWATYARTLAQELHAGPAGAASPASPPGATAPSPAVSSAIAPAASEHPNVPVGVALPVEPGKPGADEPQPSAAPPDAGVPTGGVLL